MLLGATHNHQRIQRLVPFRLDNVIASVFHCENAPDIVFVVSCSQPEGEIHLSVTVTDVLELWVLFHLLPRRAKQFPEILCRDEAKGCRALALAFAVRQLNQLTSL